MLHSKERFHLRIWHAGPPQLGDHDSYSVALVLIRQFASVDDEVVAGEIPVER